MRLGFAYCFIAFLTLAATACGPTGSMADDDSTGDDDGDSPGMPDASMPPGNPDGAPVGDAAACVGQNQNAQESTAPVDIIWAVDTSGSMDDEAAAVQNALNDFSTFIAASNIDYRVILIGDAGAINVPPPLGGGPNFLHVNLTVNSNDALEKIVQAYPQYQGFLRPNAIVHFIVVTDDESDWSKGNFDGALAGLTAPGFPGGYTFHSICSEEVVILTLPPPLPPIMGPCSGGLGAGGAAAPGKVYMGMVTATGGVWKSICTSNWTPIFSAVATAVSIPVPLPCVYDIPDPPAGQVLDPNMVNFVFTPSGGGMPATVARVADAAACGAGPGWYYDDPVNPTRILVCPATCSTISADQNGSVDIQFGCATVIED